MSKGMKFLLGLGIAALVIVGGLVYLWWIEMRLTDFIKTPTEVLDDTIYAAQQSDVDEFKRGFTKATRDAMDQMHEYNTNRAPSEFNPEIHWTWQTLMNRMAEEGGFDVTSEPGFIDRWTENTAKVKISFKARDKIYTLQKEGGAWRINLLDSDPGFSGARACVRDPVTCPK